MSNISNLDLASEIINGLKDEFAEVFLSGNLRDTIKVNINANSIVIDIPAEMYDIEKYKDEGVIIYSGNGSYAQAVNITGGFSGKHTNYLENQITNAINRWIKKHGLKARVYYE